MIALLFLFALFSQLVRFLLFLKWKIYIRFAVQRLHYENLDDSTAFLTEWNGKYNPIVNSNMEETSCESTLVQLDQFSINSVLEIKTKTIVLIGWSCRQMQTPDHWTVSNCVNVAKRGETCNTWRARENAPKSSYGWFSFLLIGCMKGGLPLIG